MIFFFNSFSILFHLLRIVFIKIMFIYLFVICYLLQLLYMLQFLMQSMQAKR